MLDIRKLNARGSNFKRYKVCITTDPVPTTAFLTYQLRRTSGLDGSNLNQRQHDSWVEHNPGPNSYAKNAAVFYLSRKNPGGGGGGSTLPPNTWSRVNGSKSQILTLNYFHRKQEILVQVFPRIPSDMYLCMKSWNVNLFHSMLYITITYMQINQESLSLPEWPNANAQTSLSNVQGRRVTGVGHTHSSDQRHMARTGRVRAWPRPWRRLAPCIKCDTVV